MSTKKYAIVIEKAPSASNYSGYAPDLPGCIATGDTVEQVIQLMREGIELHVQGMIEDGIPVPEPMTAVDYAEVAA